MSAISNLSPAELRSLSESVERKLESSSKRTKIAALEVLVDAQLCSIQSGTSLETFVKTLQKQSMQVPPILGSLFPNLTAEVRNTQPQTAAPTSVPAIRRSPRLNPTVACSAETPGPSRLDRKSSSPMLFSTLGSVSAVALRGINGTVFFSDGESTPVGSFEDADLRSNFNLIEFNASQT